MAEPRLRALPPKEAVAYFAAKGKKLDPSFAWQDRWQGEHATMFTVAKSTGFDILQDVHDALLRSQQDGTTWAEFKKRLTPILQDKGWWGRAMMADPATGEMKKVQLGSPRRLQIIFDVNMRMSYAVGRWQQIQRVKAERPWLQYSAVRDGKTRPLHRDWNGTILPVDHPWWDTHYPPNGWRCRCTVIQLSDEALRRHGLAPSAAAPDDGTARDYVNPRTGEVSRVPPGIDPGFAYHPGKAAQQATVRDIYNGKLAGGSPDLARAAIQADLEGEAFARFVAGEVPGTFAVGVLPQELMPLVGAQRQTVLLSQQTAAKQLKHPEATAAEYRRLQRMLDDGEVIRDGAQHLVFILVDGEPWYAVVKATRDGREVYLQSYRRTDRRNWDKVRKKGELVRAWRDR